VATNVVLGSGHPNYNASGSELTLEQRTFYNRNLLSRLLPMLVYTLFGVPKPMPANSGQTVQFRRFVSLAIPGSPLVEGVTPSSTNLSMTSLSATPQQEGAFIEISDLVDLTAPDPVLIEAGALLGEQAALLIDSRVRDVLVAGTNVQYAGTGNAARGDVAAGDIVTATDFRKAVRTLQNNKVAKLTSIVNASTGVGTQPIPACYVAIIGPSTHFDLKGIAGFVPVHEYGSTAGMLPGEVGQLEDIRFVLTHNAKVFTGAGTAGADVYATLILGQGAFGVIAPSGVENIVKPFGAGNDPLNQRMTTGWKAYFTAVRLEEAAILRLEHAVSA
jgi:N4-gp56 family major capsid protein